MVSHAAQEEVLAFCRRLWSLPVSLGELRLAPHAPSLGWHALLSLLLLIFIIVDIITIFLLLLLIPVSVAIFALGGLLSFLLFGLLSCPAHLALQNHLEQSEVDLYQALRQITPSYAMHLRSA